MGKLHQNTLAFQRRFLIRKTGLIIFFLAVLFISCQYTAKDIIKGNWYYYDPELGYIELYIHNDSIIKSYNLASGRSMANYKIFADSIILLDNYVKEKYHIVQLMPKQIILKKSDLSIIKLFRIDEKIYFEKLKSKSIKDINEFSEKFLVRSIENTSTGANKK